ncbi:DUF4112 domain-containing protein [Edaphobacter bradus]|uniref:DUF4112 domain-containing protein n=1 Tax=Edaphobacter bradus TaxID=2259016 RepID=UPI0021E002E8|nr:DUF4112 domain-containing protein [Edaphobacter bradus]
MQSAVKPEILSPRAKLGGRMFDDENLDLLSHVLDDFIKIPGLPIRFGLDGIMGVVPGIGDVLGGIASCVIIIAAWFRGVSYVVLARMIANVGIEVVVGAVPVLGDMFDIAWRANRRNYALLTNSLLEPRKYTIQSWIFLGAVCAVLMVLVLLPMLLLTWMATGMMHSIFGVNVHFHTWL